jgi:hypothetical protein
MISTVVDVTQVTPSRIPEGSSAQRETMMSRAAFFCVDALLPSGPMPSSLIATTVRACVADAKPRRWPVRSRFEALGRMTRRSNVRQPGCANCSARTMVEGIKDSQEIVVGARLCQTSEPMTISPRGFAVTVANL